jgi:serine/threonine protein phosphatase 1
VIPVFEENTRGRDFVIGDLHGNIAALAEKMERKQFDPAVDRIFATGDLVDRGPASDECVELINKPWFYSVQGNHEDAAILCAKGQVDPEWYLRIGGAWMLGKTQAEKWETASWLETLPLALEVEIGGGRRVGLVHACCPFESWLTFRETQDPNTSLSTRLSTHDHALIRQTAQWSRDERMEGVAGIHAVIVGHTPKPEVTSLGNVFYVDTGCGHKGGKLSMKNIKKLVGA